MDREEFVKKVAYVVGKRTEIHSLCNDRDRVAHRLEIAERELLGSLAEIKKHCSAMSQKESGHVSLPAYVSVGEGLFLVTETDKHVDGVDVVELKVLKEKK